MTELRHKNESCVKNRDNQLCWFSDKNSKIDMKL
jgi:hypothetical protein